MEKSGFQSGWLGVSCSQNVWAGLWNDWCSLLNSTRQRGEGLRIQPERSRTCCQTERDIRGIIQAVHHAIFSGIYKLKFRLCVLTRLSFLISWLVHTREECYKELPFAVALFYKSHSRENTVKQGFIYKSQIA